MRLPAAILMSLILAAGLRAQSDTTPAAPGGPATSARGPQVEITGKDGKTVVCTLLSMAGGKIDVQLPDGKRDSASTNDVKSVRFLPLPMSAAEKPVSSATPPRDEDPDERPMGPNWTLEDGMRMRQLAMRDREGKLTAAEEEELRNLRIRAPLPKYFLKRQVAEENARQEFSKGRLDSYIAGLQGKLKEARNEGDVKDSTMSLFYAYRAKKMTNAKILEQLKADMSEIGSSKTREKSLERFNELTDFTRLEARNRP